MALSIKKPRVTEQRKEELMKMLREPYSGELVRLNANIPVELHKQLKIFVSFERKKMTKVLVDMIENYITSRRKKYKIVEQETEIEEKVDP